MTRAHEEAPATWFRLSEESWAEVRREYQAGASAPQLARKWRVSPTSIYRHACKEGWTKKAGGDAAARDHAEGWEAVQAAAVADLFTPQAGEADASAADLSHQAVQAAGRAMKQGRLAEAQGLARLAEALGRVAVRAPDSTLETIYRAATDPDFVREQMAVWGEDNPDPIKRRYWLWAAERHQARDRAERARAEAAVAR